MMFNGLLMCTDSDSDFTKESFGRSSEADSPSSSCASARAQYYHNKLLATLQILQNKEETVRVQAESLAVAEARIAFLTARSNELKRDIERKGQELKALRETIQKSKNEKIDVSVQIQEIDNQKNIVTTLQNNLSVIEDLYRECFYETAKQDGLIEMLRKSYLDVRLMDKAKSDQISRLNNVINTQKWSLETCQDIASDVDNLKVEISNFLNSSNNDSGVWEESLAGDLTEDLQDIAGQLLRLMELLTGDCTCGLQLENRSLRQHNEAMENELVDLRQKINELENTLENKAAVDRGSSCLEDLRAKESKSVCTCGFQSEIRSLRQNKEAMESELCDLRQKINDLENILGNKDAVDRQCLEDIRAKESELHLIRQQLAEVECEQERERTCESIKLQLNQMQVLLSDKTAELEQMQSLCQKHERTIRQLTEELDQSKEISKEYCALRGSACATQRKVRALQEQLSKALQHCAHSEACHRSEVQALETALVRTRARSAALCEETRLAAARVRAWTRHRRDLHREQESQIKQKESRIRLLELRLDGEQNDITLTRGSENDTCSKCISARSNHSRYNVRTESKTSERNIRSASQQPSCSRYLQNEGSCTSAGSRRREYTHETSESEIADSSPPVPPQRPSRSKRFICENRAPSCPTREASVQRPEGRDVGVRASPTWRNHHVGHAHLIDTMPREVFGVSVEETLRRVERAGAALGDSLRRWDRHGSTYRTSMHL